MAVSATAPDKRGGIGALLRRGDIALALGLTAILVVLIMPMP